MFIHPLIKNLESSIGGMDGIKEIRYRLGYRHSIDPSNFNASAEPDDPFFLMGLADGQFDLEIYQIGDLTIAEE